MEKYNNKENIGSIINKGLKNPTVIEICTHNLDETYLEIKKIQMEFSRFIGFAILFRSIENVDKYMLLKNKEDQIYFLKKMISEKLNISELEIYKKRKEIIKFAFENFKKKGFVFHAANSLSAENKMINGLKDNDVNLEEQKELLKIEYIYRKYNSNSKYSPIGHGATDIINNKTGWFFDGLPIHSTTYANSPQWFNYLCGKSYIYFNDFSAKERNGYEKRNYKKALNVILWLINNENMIEEDKKKLLYFFNKTWNKYKNTKPYLIFIPVDEVKINEQISLEEYLTIEGEEKLFNDIILGAVNPIKNCCSNKIILPEKLSVTDLSSILPRD